MVNASWAAAAAATASRSATVPSDDCTALKATTSVSRVDRPGQLRERRRTDLESTLCEERPRERAEVDLRARARASRRAGPTATRRDEVRDARARGHALGRHADERGEVLARAVGRVAPVLPARAAVAPVGECLLERVPGRRRREAERRGVEIRPGRLPQGACVRDREHGTIKPALTRRAHPP